jgi:hypothetical protein
MCAAFYGLATIFFFANSSVVGWRGTVAGVVGLGVMVGATVHALSIRRSGFADDRLPTPPPTGWRPAAPTVEARPSNPLDPSTVRTPFDCTRYDHHALGVPLSRTLPFAAAGAATLVLDLLFDLPARTLGVGFDGVSVPIFAALFRQRLEGGTLRFRWWGVPRELPSPRSAPCASRLDRGASRPSCSKHRVVDGCGSVSAPRSRRSSLTPSITSGRGSIDRALPSTTRPAHW